jgi:hypothetical protein
MTAEEHYREAERLLGEAADANVANPLGPASRYLVAAAQVHATLATVGEAGGPATGAGPAAGRSVRG